MIAKYIDDNKVDDLKKMFASMDADGNGTLTLQEVAPKISEGTCAGRRMI